MTKAFLRSETRPLIGKETIEYIIQAGSQAPSYLNGQPWKFKIINNVIELYLYDNKEELVVNWNNMSSLIACGAAIENMKIASSYKGCDSFVELLPQFSEDKLIARLIIKRKENVEINDDTVDMNYAIWMRHTNTSLYKCDDLKGTLISELECSIKQYSNVKVEFAVGEKKKLVFKALSSAEIIRFSRKDLHRQLHKMIRWGRHPALNEKTGYTLGSMGLCSFGKIFFKMTQSWFVNNALNYIGAAKNSAKQSSNGLLNCGAIGNITIKGKTNIDLINGGMAIQKLWLMATKLKLDLQPHNSLSLFNWTRKNGGEVQFSKKEISLLDQSSKELEHTFSPKEASIFLFRIGYGKPVAGRTFRKN